MQHLQANLEIFAAIAVAGVSLLLSMVSFLSWSRLRNLRALFICFAFLAFFVKGAYLVALSMESRGTSPWLFRVALLDLVALLLMYLAIKKR